MKKKQKLLKVVLDDGQSFEADDLRYAGPGFTSIVLSEKEELQVPDDNIRDVFTFMTTEKRLQHIRQSHSNSEGHSLDSDPYCCPIPFLLAQIDAERDARQKVGKELSAWKQEFGGMDSLEVRQTINDLGAEAQMAQADLVQAEVVATERLNVLCAIRDFVPNEVVYDTFAYKRMADGFRDAARKGISGDGSALLAALTGLYEALREAASDNHNGRNHHEEGMLVAVEQCSLPMCKNFVAVLSAAKPWLPAEKRF